MVCVIGSNCPFEIEYCFLSKGTHPTKIVIFWTLVYELPKCAKTKHEHWTTLDIKWTEKYQLHHVTSSCWFDLPMPILFPMHICFQFFWEKIFFFCTSEMAIKCVFSQLKSCNLVQMKANQILFILAFFQCYMTHGSKVMTIWLDHLISCRNEIFWIDNSHHWNLGSTSQFRNFWICMRRNKWMKTGLRFKKC